MRRTPLLVALLVTLSVSTSFAQRERTKNPTPAMWDTNEVYIELAENVDVQKLASDYGLKLKRTFLSNSNKHVLVADSVEHANQAVNKLRSNQLVVQTLNNQGIGIERFWAPNDPYFNNNRLGGQWHLQNNIGAASPGHDMNAVGAWNKNYTGAGVTVGLIDDGFQWDHPDLAANWDALNSYDFGQNDNNPYPVDPADTHGTATSGLVAARGGNGIGTTGVAPHARFGGMRLDFNGGSTIADVADAVLYRSNVYDIKNHSYGISPLFIDNPLNDAAVTSTSNNTIHVWAAGNDRLDASKNMVRNNVNSIVVAAVGHDGVRADYTRYGANILVTAPTSDFAQTFRITTTDLTGSNGYNDGTGSNYNASDGLPNPANYTGTFGGTSTSAPLVSGAIALAKEANPNLNIRMAKHLLVMTSQKTDLGNNDDQSDGGWRANGAGNLFNQNFGFGTVDAGALVTAAENVVELSPLQVESTGMITVNEDIDTTFAPPSLTRNFTLNTNNSMEDLLITLNFDHEWRGDLGAYVTSPSGFRSRLFDAYGNDDAIVDDFQWTFRTVAFWGENAQGVWSIELVDTLPSYGGRWNWFSAEAYMGTLTVNSVPEPGTGMLALLAATCVLWRRRRST